MIVVINNNTGMVSSDGHTTSILRIGDPRWVLKTLHWWCQDKSTSYVTLHPISVIWMTRFKTKKEDNDVNAVLCQKENWESG